MTLPYPRPTSLAVSAVMRANTKRDTKPELRLRSALHARGLRFRKDYLIDVPRLRVRADVVFTRQRIAVFMDGCYWHSCPDHGTSPRSNSEYWSQKLRGNRERDDRVNRALTEAGWIVVRVWEHAAMEDAVSRVCQAWATRRPDPATEEDRTRAAADAELGALASPPRPDPVLSPPTPRSAAQNP